MTSKHETASQVLQAIPAVSLVGVKVLGLSLPDWAAVFGIGFVILQVIYLVWRWRREARDG